MSLREWKVYQSKSNGTSDFCHPKNEEYNFDCYLVAIEKHNIFAEFNFIMSDGSRSSGMSPGETTTMWMEPSDVHPKKIVVRYNPANCVTGFTFSTED